MAFSDQAQPDPAEHYAAANHFYRDKPRNPVTIYWQRFLQFRIIHMLIVSPKANVDGEEYN